MFCPFSPTYSRDSSPLAGTVSLVAAGDRGSSSDRSKAVKITYEPVCSESHQSRRVTNPCPVPLRQ